MRKCFLLITGIYANVWCGMAYTYFMQGITTDALAGYRSTTMDIWQVSGNQAGIAEISMPMLSAYYRQRFMLADLADKSIAFVFPTAVVHSGFSCQVFGNNSYRETRLSLGAARKFGQNFSAGLRFNRYSTHVNNKGISQHVLYNVDAGIISNMGENLRWGCYVLSIVPERVVRGQVSSLPTLMGVGVSYLLYSKVQVMTEIRLTSVSYYSWTGAVQIQPFDRLLLLTGLQIDNDNAYMFSFGFAYQLSNYGIGLALVQHQRLGITPSFQISYRFGRK